MKFLDILVQTSLIGVIFIAFLHPTILMVSVVGVAYVGYLGYINQRGVISTRSRP